MQSPSVRVASAGEAITDYRRVGFAADTDQRSENSRNQNPLEPFPASQRVGLAIQYMLRHLNEPLRISTLAAMTGLSPSHFFSLFKSATGFTPIAFFIGLRMQRACELLEKNESNIKETAELVGYNDKYYFSRLFKQVIGVPPGEYQRTSVGSSAKTLEGASSNAARANGRLPSLAFAFSTMKDLGIVTAAEPGPAGASSNLCPSCSELIPDYRSNTLKP